MQRTGYQLIGIRHIRIDMADICVCETFIHGQLDNGPQREGKTREYESFSVNSY